MGAMRLVVSDQQMESRDCLDGGAAAGIGAMWNVRGHRPSMECLMTLLWATKVIDRENRSPVKSSSSPMDLERNSTTQGIGRARMCEMENEEELFAKRSVHVNIKRGLTFRGAAGKGSMASHHHGEH